MQIDPWTRGRLADPEVQRGAPCAGAVSAPKHPAPHDLAPRHEQQFAVWLLRDEDNDSVVS